MIHLMRSSAAVLLVLVVLGGCSILPERAPKQTFMLPPPNLAALQAAPIPLTLRILTPHVEPPLNGSGILVNPEGQIIKAYKGARWQKPIPLLLRDHWIDGLRQAGRLAAVVHETSDADGDLSLASDLSLFHLKYPQNTPVVVIQVDAQLLESNTRQVLATRRFRVQQAVPDQPASALIDGFGAVSQALAKDLSHWLEGVTREYVRETDHPRPPSGTGSSTIK